MDAKTYRIPLLAALGLTVALGVWLLVSWQNYQEKNEDWKRQRAQDSFETLNGVIAAMSTGELTDWDQIESVLNNIIRNSRTLFVIVQGRHGRLVESGKPPCILDTSTSAGETDSDNVYVYWAPLRPLHVPTTWAGAFDFPRLGLGMWPESNPIMYLGFQGGKEQFGTSWFWERQAYLFGSMYVCVLAVTAVWITANRRRILAEQLASERVRIAHLEELGLAAAGLAHETKNPLGIIMGMAQQIAGNTDIPTDSRIMLEHIMDEVDKTTSRLGNFMSFAKPYAPRMASTDVTALAREVTEVLGPDFDTAMVSLSPRIAPTHVMADASMLRQILVNLLLNSLHASAPGTNVEIILRRNGARYDLIVRDQGCGIDPALLSEIFKPYTTGSPTGHGLGLPIVKRMVEAHGWHIEVHSLQGHGTTMTITGLKPATEPA